MASPFEELLRLILKDLLPSSNSPVLAAVAQVDADVKAISSQVSNMAADITAIKNFLGVGDQAAGITVSLGQPADKPQQ